ncbi:hypothetical protein J437_LFUL007178 [Ladona fulva]|uniref:Uncharacterized protein n=1 Tax=Ladona fulva TaxID=123851 RepID=A0A8K0K6E4_LADFU|nr:hypothetical protein J437_LFUL007178 [Ladona fulva]
MAGLRVIAIVCDMGANNVKAIRPMGSSIMHPFIKFQSHTIYTLDTFYGTASWVHIQDAYQFAKGAILNGPLAKLTEDHMCPQGAKKMKVKLAAQVMSRALATYVEDGCRSGWLPQGALATSAFLRTMDDLFDSMNGGRQRDSYKPLLKGVTMESSHFQFWEEATALVKEWKIPKKTREGDVRFSAMPPSQQGWLNNLNAFPLLCKDMLTGPGAVRECIPARSFNQDPIENLFSCIRGNCGSNTRPTTTQFISSLKTCCDSSRLRPMGSRLFSLVVLLSMDIKVRQLRPRGGYSAILPSRDGGYRRVGKAPDSISSLDFVVPCIAVFAALGYY